MQCNVMICNVMYVYVYIYIYVCVQILDSLHDICMWPLDSFDGIHTLKGAVPLLAWQAKSDGGNGFIGQVASLAGTSTREMIAQDSLDSIGSLMPAVCSPHVARSCFAAAVFMHYARSSASKIKKYQNDPGISSNLCMCFISAVFCSLIKCCMPWKGAITPVASCDAGECQSSSACGLGSLCWHLRANMRE